MLHASIVFLTLFWGTSRIYFSRKFNRLVTCFSHGLMRATNSDIDVATTGETLPGTVRPPYLLDRDSKREGIGSFTFP